MLYIIRSRGKGMKTNITTYIFPKRRLISKLLSIEKLQHICVWGEGGQLRNLSREIELGDFHFHVAAACR